MTVELGALIVLAVTNIATLAYHAWYIYLEQKSKNKMLNSFIAKNSQDFTNFELSDKMQKIPKVEPQPDLRSDLQELKDLSEEEFDKNVLSR